MSLYLSRLTLSRAPAVAVLNALLDPAAEGARQDAHHRLVWSAFAGDSGARRDFLWRAEGGGRFLVLSRRPPADSPLFEPPETRSFSPDLAAGDRLAFVLRANATRTEKTGTLSSAGKERKRHIDLVMDALHGVPKTERAAQRMPLAQAAAQDWLAAQGGRYGFALRALAVEDYAVMALPRPAPPGAAAGPSQRSRRGQPQFGILDLSGLLEITHPVAFLEQLAAGFGRARAFGCGLMLIRRA